MGMTRSQELYARFNRAWQCWHRLGFCPELLSPAFLRVQDKWRKCGKPADCGQFIAVEMLIDVQLQNRKLRAQAESICQSGKTDGPGQSR